MSDKTIGTALRARRTDLGIDQHQAADLIGMSRTTFSSYERDLQRPSAEVLSAIATFLNVSIDDVLELYGASAIVAARSALERLDRDLKQAPHDRHASPVGAETADGAVGHDLSSTLPLGSPTTAALDTVNPSGNAGVTDERKKTKGKKKKKGKRSKKGNTQTLRG